MTQEFVCTDAVHHRLAPNDTELNISVLSSNWYECYDCSKQFPTFQGFMDHVNSPDFPFHSRETCLKCREAIIIPVQVVRGNRSVSRLHSCTRESLRQQNSDLYLASNHLATKLDFPETDNDDRPSVFCLICPKSYRPTREGLFRYLKHSNKWLHNVNMHCRLCNIPKFHLTYENSFVICHVCAKYGKPSVVTKEIN